VRLVGYLKRNVEENRIFYVQRVFATRFSIFDIIEEKITLTLNFQHQPSVNLKSRKCNANLYPSDPSHRAKSKKRGSFDCL
jgi:hypothetical protein